MKRLLTAVLSLVVLLTSVDRCQSQDVSVPDAALKLAIWIELDEPWPDAGILTVDRMLRLTQLDAGHIQVKSLQGLETAHNLVSLSLAGNRHTTLTLPSGLTRLASLDLSDNVLTNLTLPADLAGLKHLDLGYNKPLRQFGFLRGLTELTNLNLEFCGLTSLTLPPSMTKLSELNLLGNPLQALIVPDSLLQGALRDSLAEWGAKGVTVVGYPVETRLLARLNSPSSDLQIELHGPPGIYQIHSAKDLVEWKPMAWITNANGVASIPDPSHLAAPLRFYRAITSE